MQRLVGPLGPLARCQVAVGLALAAWLWALSGCGSDDGSRQPDASNDGAASATSTSSSTSSSSTSSTTTTSPPDAMVAADGTNSDACFDGTCEIEVTGTATIPIVDSFNLSPLMFAVSRDGVNVETTTSAAISYETWGATFDLTTDPSGITTFHIGAPGGVGKAKLDVLTIDVTAWNGQAAIVSIHAE